MDLMLNTLVDHFFPLILAVFLLQMIYELIKTDWPDQYFSGAQTLGRFISETPVRFIAFRLLPTLLVSTFVAGVTFEVNLVAERVYFGMLIGLLHISITNARALLKIMRNSPSTRSYLNRPNQILYHVMSIFFVVLTGAIGGVCSMLPFLRQLLPTTQGIVDNIWSSILTAILVLFIYRKLIEGRQLTDFDLLIGSRGRLNHIEDFINNLELEVPFDKKLVLATAMVENLQRPPWARNLERIVSRVSRRGTYGILQVSSDKYIGDEESIEVAIDQFFGKLPPISSRQVLISSMMEYNPNPEFANLVEIAYRILEPPEHYQPY